MNSFFRVGDGMPEDHVVEATLGVLDVSVQVGCEVDQVTGSEFVHAHNVGGAHQDREPVCKAADGLFVIGTVRGLRVHAGRTSP